MTQVSEDVSVRYARTVEELTAVDRKLREAELLPARKAELEAQLSTLRAEMNKAKPARRQTAETNKRPNEYKARFHKNPRDTGP